METICLIDIMIFLESGVVIDNLDALSLQKGMNKIMKVWDSRKSFNSNNKK